MSKPRKLLIAAKAKRDAIRAADWYEEQDPGRGKDFADDFDRTLKRICEAPRLYQVVHRAHGREVRRANFGFYPYKLLFHEVDDGLLYVMLVSHQRQKPTFEGD